MGMGAAQDTAREHPRRHHVGPETRAPRHLVDAVRAVRPGAHNLEILDFLGVIQCHHDALRMSAAVSITARMILS